MSGLDRGTDTFKNSNLRLAISPARRARCIVRAVRYWPDATVTLYRMPSQRRSQWGLSLAGEVGAEPDEDAEDELDAELIALLRRNLSAAGVRGPGGARRSLNVELSREREASKKRSKRKGGPPPEVPADAGGLEKPPDGFLPKSSHELPIRPSASKTAAAAAKEQKAAKPVSRKPEVPRTSGRSFPERAKKSRQTEKQLPVTTDGETDGDEAAVKASKKAEVREHCIFL